MLHNAIIKFSLLLVAAIYAHIPYITLVEVPDFLLRSTHYLDPTMASKYPHFQPYGQKLIRWMENVNEPGCPVQISELNTETLPRPTDWRVNHSRGWLSSEQIASIVGLGLPIGDLIPNDLYPTESPCLQHSIIKTIGGTAALIGTIAPGVLFIYSIKRRPLPSNDPYMSQLAKMAYETHFPLDSLKYVIVNEIQEHATETFVMERIYPSREGLSYPSAEPQTWDYPLPEFTAIMGTPIGKVVGSFILGAFGQGVKRIAQIVTFQDGLELHKLHVGFHIEDVQI